MSLGIIMNWYYKLASSGISLWLDDERDPTDPNIQNGFGSLGNEIWVKTAPEAINILSGDNVTSISLDHDLGEPEAEKGNGNDVATWIEEKAFHGELTYSHS